jgi:uncharacterized protein
MPVPAGLGVIDTMIGMPTGDRRWWARSMAPLLLDQGSKGEFQHAASYMYKELPPEPDMGDDPVAVLLREMDAHGVAQGLLPVAPDDAVATRAIREHPDRLIGSYLVDPLRGMEGVRELEMVVREQGVKAAAFFPCGCVPQVPIDDRMAYPIYAKCVELDIPIFINTGVPGPRVPMDAQEVRLLDKVCWFFPELRIVMRHGGEPWVNLAVKLMVKYENLYYSTSAFAPKYYPREIIEYANSSRGSGKVIYAGYYPSGLTLERIFRELNDLPFAEATWPKFLRDNAREVLRLG